MTNRASQSIRAGIIIGLFVAISLQVESMVRLKYNDSEHQSYPIVDTTMHIDAKKVVVCIGCARFPMARMVVTAKKKRLVNDEASSITGKVWLQAPDAPKTPIRATLVKAFNWVGKSRRNDVRTQRRSTFQFEFPSLQQL